jgi:cytochrome bd ubiquinol oxidase subunit I
MIVAMLSRIQFGVSIGFHIIFPTLNLGLAVFLVLMELSWLRTKNPVYLSICKFWTKIFALTFGMGVVSGIVLAYQIGTNFGPFIAKFGNVLGALFAYETLTAFFLEAGFLGVMLFGWKKFPPLIHFMATLLVTIGTTVSAFWILSANSWMQTPSGYELLNGEFVVQSWFDVVFNPSFIPRYLHMLLASYITCCFVVAAVSSYYLIKKQHLEFAKICLSSVMWASLVLVPAQILVGDIVGLIVHEHQPIKTAAIEGNWQTQRGAPLVLFAWPNAVQEKNDFVISIPKVASFINTHDWNGELTGLTSVPPEDRPNVASVFFTFRIMVGIAFLLLATAILALVLRFTNKLYTLKAFHYWCYGLGITGFIASIAGWLTAESGRQPWVVYNLMRTHDAVSALGMEEVIISMTLLLITYVIIFGFYLNFIFKTISKGPSMPEADNPSHSLFHYMTDNPDIHDKSEGS